MKKLLVFLSACFVWPVWALDIVATTSSMGMLAREVGGPSVTVTELAPPDRDAHMLQARPSMIRALRDAELVVAVGAELEIGWLPAAIASAANPALLPGKPGYFEAAAQVPLLEAGQAADRAHGDVHPAGNPHVNLDPARMATIASALAERLAQIDAGNAAGFRERAKRFAAAVAARTPGWKEKVVGSTGAVLYHKDGNYLLAFFGLPVLGYLEPVPGVPPTASHLDALATKLKDKRGVILHAPYQPPAGAGKLAGLLGWQANIVPLDPPANAGAAAWFALIDGWVKALAAAR